MTLQNYGNLVNVFSSSSLDGYRSSLSFTFANRRVNPARLALWVLSSSQRARFGAITTAHSLSPFFPFFFIQRVCLAQVNSRKHATARSLVNSRSRSARKIRSRRFRVYTSSLGFVRRHLKAARIKRSFERNRLSLEDLCAPRREKSSR